MSQRPTGPACGNNPNYRMSDGDRQAVEDFKAYLANRAAVERVRTVLETEAVVGRSALEYRGLIASALMADEAQPAETTEPDETDEQRADREETERDHAAGNHQYCGVTCEAEFPSDMLRNTILYRAIPGSKTMLAELERRAAAEAATDVDLPARLEAALTERYTELGNPFSRMRRQEQGPDGWPAEHPVGPHHVAEVLRELLADETQPAQPQHDVTVHAIPVPGSNGISSCCGRPPCEFVGERLTRDPALVTCPGPASGAQQPTNPREICVCGHTRGEHLRVSGRLLCDACDPDSTENLVCKEYTAL
jgi:hypothetical protein